MPPSRSAASFVWSKGGAQHGATLALRSRQHLVSGHLTDQPEQCGVAGLQRLRHILHEPVVDPDIGERTAARPSRGTKCNPSHRDHEDETDQQASERARGGASSSGMEDLLELDPTVPLLDGDDSIAEFDQIKSLYSP